MPTSHARNTSHTVDKRGRVAKRSGNACVRCRTQKIKCSGSQPCEACQKRKLSCRFDEHDQKILVTKGYIFELQRRIEDLQRDGSVNGCSATEPFGATSQSSIPADMVEDDTLISSVHSLPARVVEEDAGSGRDNDGTSGFEDEPQSPRRTSLTDPVASILTNPLSGGASTFMTASDGKAYYLGTSSNWSFCRRVLSLAHEYVRQSPISPDLLLFDSSTYDLGWDGSRTTPPTEAPLLPSLDHAIYLIGAVKFHCTQMFHLFDETSFMEALRDFYSDPTPKMLKADLTYIHLLLIFGFGKALAGRKNHSKRPLGSEYFVKALQILPDIHVLSKEPVVSTEILCCIALYYQSLDFRHAAHQFIGQAMRMALSYGMHTKMPVQHFGEHMVERCRGIWWTVYMLDREMTSLMGLPHSINDDDVHASLPSFFGSVERSLALAMQIRLSQIIATINSKVYGADGRLRKKFLEMTKDVLSDIAGLADELQQSFPLRLDRTLINGVPRLSAHLNLLYHQCIILATRPLLLCFLKLQFESPESYFSVLNSSNTVLNLIKRCMESSQQMISILTCLKIQGLLETFLPFDLESLFVSTVNLILGPVLDSQLHRGSTPWLKKSYEIFDEIMKSGNLVAGFRRSELRQLEDLLGHIAGHRPDSQPAIVNLEQQDYSRDSRLAINEDTITEHTNQANTALMSPPRTETQIEGDSGMVFTTAQIMDMADSIANIDADWMQDAILEQNFW